MKIERMRALCQPCKFPTRAALSDGPKILLNSLEAIGSYLWRLVVSSVF